MPKCVAKSGFCEKMIGLESTVKFTGCIAQWWFSGIQDLLASIRKVIHCMQTDTLTTALAVRSDRQTLLEVGWQPHTGAKPLSTTR